MGTIRQGAMGSFSGKAGSITTTRDLNTSKALEKKAPGISGHYLY